MDRKTTTILCAAGGLVAAAAILGARNDRASGALPSPPPTGPALSCGSSSPARAKIDFGHGTMDAALSGAKVLRASDGQAYLAIDIEARDLGSDKRPPMNLAIVIDRSGSMAGEKIAQAREAARGIADRLGPKDRVALVQYDDGAQVLVPAIPMDAEGKARMRAAIDGIVDAGGTNLHGGMMLGVEEMRRTFSEGRVSRVILLSDGQANVGITDPRAITLDATSAADQGVRITTVGLGLDYNEDLMEAIAEHGRGQYYYVRDAGALDAVFAGELRSIQATVATRAQLRLEPSCAGVEIDDVYGYAWSREGDAVVVPLADLAGGDKRKIVVRVKLPTGAAGRTDVLRATFSYDDAQQGGRKSATAALGVEITDDAQAAKASADKDVLAKVEHAEAGKAMREAAAAYERGDRQAAQQVIRSQRARTETRARDYGLAPSATVGVFSELDDMEKGVMAAEPGSIGGKDLTKKSKAAARALSK